MHDHPDARESSGIRLLWALRRHALLLTAAAVVVLALTTVAVLRLVVAPPTYSARAAVIATQLEFSAERVPRLAAAVAQQESVLADAVQRGQLPWSTEDLREEHVQVTPLEENVLVTVDGEADSPALAIQTANAVAGALADALDRSGTEAEFAVQERASTAEPEPRLVPVAVTVLAGLVAATALVLGLGALLLALRRPVTTAAQARRLTGARVLSVVHLPRRGRPVSPLPGLAALERELDRVGAPVALLTSTADEAAVRSSVAVGFAHHLGLSRDVTLVPSTRSVPLLIDLPDESRVLVHERSHPLPEDAGMSVVDGFDDERAAWREALPEGVVVVLVLAEGAPETDVRRVLDRFEPEDLAGVVFVVRRRRGSSTSAYARWTTREQELAPPPDEGDAPAAALSAPERVVPSHG